MLRYACSRSVLGMTGSPQEPFHEKILAYGRFCMASASRAPPLAAREPPEGRQQECAARLRALLPSVRCFGVGKDCRSNCIGRNHSGRRPCHRIGMALTGRQADSFRPICACIPLGLSSRAATWSTLGIERRAAASSIARGMPSSL